MNSYGEGMDTCIPTVFAFVLTCKLTDPKAIMGFACIITRLGMEKYNFFYYESPHCNFDLRIFHQTFLLPWTLSKITFMCIVSQLRSLFRFFITLEASRLIFILFFIS